VSGGLRRDPQSATSRVPDRRRHFLCVARKGDGGRSLVDQ
jgi:hypothetical protein